MLNDSDYEVKQMVSRFIGAIADRFYGVDCGSVTEVFTTYVDVINLLYRRRNRPGWNENESQLLKKQSLILKIVLIKYFQNIILQEWEY